MTDNTQYAHPPQVNDMEQTQGVPTNELEAENSVAMAWNTVRAEARALTAHRLAQSGGLSDLFAAVEEYGDRRAAQAMLSAAPQAAECVDPMCACRGGPCAECPEGEREKELADVQSSLYFYKCRCDALQACQSTMRDPERTMVCDILANGSLLMNGQGKLAAERYAAPQAQPVAEVQANGVALLRPVARRLVLDAIRGAYDLGYRDARNASAVSGDSAPGYKGRDVETAHGEALIHALEALESPAPAQAQPQAQDLDADAAGYFEEQKIRDLARVFSSENSYAIGGRWEWSKFTPDEIVALVRAAAPQAQPVEAEPMSATGEPAQGATATSKNAGCTPACQGNLWECMKYGCHRLKTVAQPAQPVEAEQAPAPAHGDPAQLDWAVGHAISQFFASMDNGDGTVSFDHCDSDDIDELVKVVLTEVSATQPAQPVREPMSSPVYAQLVASNVNALKVLLRNMLDPEQFDSGVEAMLDEIAEGVDEAMGDAYAEGRQDQLGQDREDLVTPSCAVARSQAARDVLAERQRQISVKGWTPEHDDEHNRGEMSLAASCYAEQGPEPYGVDYPRIPARWPWDPEWWKPSSYRRNLVKAGALILAEIERLDRAGIGSKGGTE